MWIKIFWKEATMEKTVVNIERYKNISKEYWEEKYWYYIPK